MSLCFCVTPHLPIPVAESQAHQEALERVQEQICVFVDSQEVTTARVDPDTKFEQQVDYRGVCLSPGALEPLPPHHHHDHHDHHDHHHHHHVPDRLVAHMQETPPC